jgi:hypothetical protein
MSAGCCAGWACIDIPYAVDRERAQALWVKRGEMVGGRCLEDLLAGLTGDVLANSWHTNFATKRLLRETDGMSLAEGLAHEHYHHPGFAPDHKERIARFSGK